MASPVSTITNATGNLLSSQSLGASGTVTFDLDLSAKFEAEVQIGVLPGASVSTTNGVQVDCYRKIGTSALIDTDAAISFQIPSLVASTQRYKSLSLPTSRWRIKLTNLDAANVVTVECTDDSVDSIT